MLVFPSMLLEPARQAGMAIPETDENYNRDDFDKEKFPHFTVFCKIQLCRRMTSLDEHWRNAEVIAKISDNDIRKVTVDMLRKVGVVGI